LLLVAASCGGGPSAGAPEAGEERDVVTIAFEDALESEIAMDHPDWPLNALGSIWVNRETGEIERIDPDREEIVATIDTDGYPCQNTVVAAGDLWTIDCSTSELLRLDPSKRRIEARIPIDGLPRQTFGSIAFAAGRIWVQAFGEGGYYVVAVDPASEKPADPVFVGKEAAGMAASGDHLWISNPFEGAVYEFDTASGQVVGTLEGLDEPRWLVAAAESVWVLNEGDGTVTRIDEETAEVEATVDAGDAGSGGYIVSGDGAVWARPSGKLYVRIDPATNAITHEVAGDFGVGGLALGFGSIWATALEEGKLWRLTLP
jgi:streptogramin lyase